MVTYAQLLELGRSRSAIARATRSGRLYAVHRAVYSTVPPPARPPFAAEQAALLASGERAVLSHASAAAVWGLSTLGRAVHITVVGRSAGRPRPGLASHRATRLDRRDVRRHQGLLVTAPARTLLDWAAVLTDDALERALDDALVRRIVRRSEVRAMLERYHRHRHTTRLRALVDDRRGTAWTRSAAERAFLDLVRRGGLPHPEVNADFGGFEVDFVWRAERLVVEIDGYLTHRSRRQLENDHRKDAALQAAGVLVLRFSARRIAEHAEAVLVETASRLATRRDRAA